MSCYVLLLYYYTKKMATLFCFFKTEFPRSPDFFFAPKVTWHSGTRLYNLTP